jgi:Protein of unknown function (DUF2849)
MLVKARGPQQTISGNRLLDGVPVWLGADGTWKEKASEAAILAAEAVAPLLERLKAQEATRVVDLYPLDVESAPHGPVPVHVRERMRAHGPSVVAWTAAAAAVRRSA